MKLQIDTEKNRKMVAERALAALPKLLAAEELLVHPGKLNRELDAFGNYWNFMPTSDFITKRATGMLNQLRVITKVTQETVAEAMRDGIIPDGPIPGVPHADYVVLVMTKRQATGLYRFMENQMMPSEIVPLVDEIEKHLANKGAFP